MPDAKIELAISGPVANIVLSDPANRNAFDLRFVREFARAAIACAANDEVKVVVLRAKGDAFSVGGDIRHFVENRDHLREHVLEMASLFRRRRHLFAASYRRPQKGFRHYGDQPRPERAGSARTWHCFTRLR